MSNGLFVWRSLSPMCVSPVCVCVRVKIISLAVTCTHCVWTWTECPCTDTHVCNQEEGRWCILPFPPLQWHQLPSTIPSHWRERDYCSPWESSPITNPLGIVVIFISFFFFQQRSKVPVCDQSAATLSAFSASRWSVHQPDVILSSILKTNFIHFDAETLWLKQLYWNEWK